MKTFLVLPVLIVIAITGSAQNVGIGTTSPFDKLHVHSGKIRLEDISYPWISFVNNSSLQGFIGAENENMRVGTWPGNSTGNLCLRTNGTDRFTVTPSGNIGIGTTAPDLKLHVTGGTDVSATGGGYLQLGLSTSTNIGIDNNEIQARNNGAASTLYLQNSGGQLLLGPKITITETAKVYRDLPLSSNADMLPIAYGKITSAGNVISGTGNFYASRTGVGDYRFVLIAEPNVYANKDQYIVIVSAMGISNNIMISWDIGTDNSIQVGTVRPVVHFTNTSCGEGSCLQSLIINSGFYDAVDCGFSFIVYKI